MERKAPRYAHADGHTDVIYSSDGKEILTCGSDGDIRVWSDLEDDDPRSVCVGEWALSINLQNDRLYVSTDNHAVQMYTYPAFDKDGVVTRFTAPVTHIVASDKNSVVVCCSENMEAKICSKNEDNKWSAKTLEHPGPVLGLALCPMAKYCMTSCGDGVCRLWNLEDSSVVKEIQAIPKVNSFYSAKVLGRSSFEPKTGKLLAYPSNKEVIVLDTKNWQQKFALTHPKVKSPFSICLFSPCGNYLAASTIVGQIVIWNVNELNSLGITEDSSSQNISSMAWNPSDNGELAFCDTTGQLATVINCYGNVIEDAADDIDENLDLIDIIEREKENGDANSELPESDGDDDENTISLRKLKNENLGNVLDGERSRSRSRSRSKSRSKSRSPKRPQNVSKQAPFQPFSTPAHLEHRYMCWNEVGIIRCHNNEEYNNLDIEFHDTFTNHNIHLNNHLSHTLGSLSKSIAVFACESPSKILGISLIGGTNEWVVALNDLEEVLCLIATENLIAAATTCRYLRIYTTLGFQLQVICLLGSPVCLSGRAGFINVIYHSSEPGLEDQHLAMDVVQVKGTSAVCRRSGIQVPLSTGSRLQWFGCTEKGSPVALDSIGILRLYNSSSCLWIPICDTTLHCKGVSDTYYIVSISEENQQATGVLCRGTPFPPTAPVPIVTQLPLKLPFCDMDTEKGEHEEKLCRSSVLPKTDDTDAQTEVILKLFALACRTTVEQRAVEIIELLHNHRITTLASRYASRLGRVNLADKLSNLTNAWNSNRLELEPSEDHEIEQSAESEEFGDNDTSFIIPTSKPIEETVLKPIPVLRSSQGSRNPFRLSGSGSKSNHNPLSLTDRKLINDENNSIASNSVLSNPLPSETFCKWFERHRSILQSQHPDLTPSDLTKTSIKTYKGLLLQATNEGAQKRKLTETETTDDVNTSAAAPKQSKLSAFAFHKKN